MLAIGTCGYLVISEIQTWDRHTLPGPASALGYQVSVKVSDCMPFLPGSDYYADLEIRDAGNKVVFSWEDPTGQDSFGAVREMMKSISWANETKVAFRCTSGTVAIQLRPSGEWDCRFTAE